MLQDLDIPFVNESKPSEETLFETLSQLPPSKRITALAQACGQDGALRERLEALLAAHDRASGFMAESVAPQLPGNGGFRIPLAERLGDQIGPYKLVQRLGEGGCGVVYMAQQEKPVRRLVALKVIKLGMDTRQVVARFEAERQALALMDHPSIAKVLDAGATDTGRPFFVMELVRGTKITEYCDQNQLPTAERLALFIQVCKAVQHAHQKGVIHRDLKPSNILVTVNDGVAVPKVIDFGIAKATQGRLTDMTVVTAFEQFIGTPAYVSPEQAVMTSLDVDTRSDIYSLGVLLYELLTGRTPFDAAELLKAGLDQMRRTIREVEPVTPSTCLTRLQTANASRIGAQSKIENQKSKIDKDLDWIVMKCLEKDRNRRYETANGLARDVERHLHNEPVLARPTSRFYEFQKTVHRHWVGFATVSAILAALTIGVVISTFEAVRARRAEKEQTRLREAAESAQVKEAAQRQRAEADEELGRRLVYAGKMNLLQAAWEQNLAGEVRELLSETAAYPEHGFEWYYWQRQTHMELKTLRGHLDWVNDVAFSPGGRRCVTGSMDQTAKVWDVASGQELFSLEGHLHGVDPVSFSPDGARIVTGSMDATAKIWDAANGKELRTLQGHIGPVLSVAFSPDSGRVATGSRDATAKIWDSSTGQLLFTLSAHHDGVESVAFSPDGRWIATASDDRTAKIWDAASGKELFTLVGHNGAVTCVAFSQRGQRIATGSDDLTAKVWDASSRVELLTLRGHHHMVNSVKFSPDGNRLLTASDDRTARIWDANTGREIFTIKGHNDKVEAGAFSPDGQYILTGSDDQTARIWDATHGQKPITLTGHTNEVIAVAFALDGRRIATGGGDNFAKVWDAATGELLLTLSGHSRPVRSVAFSPDSARIVTGSGDHKARVWNAITGECLFTVEGHSGPISGVAWSPDGQWIGTSSADQTVRLWDARSYGCLRTINGPRGAVACLAFSPDNRQVVAGTGDNTVRIWSTANGSQISILKGHSGPVVSVAFSPDGRRIISGSLDHTARVWDTATGTNLVTLNGHTDRVESVAWSPDGLRLVTGSVDQTAKIWDAIGGDELLTLKGHEAPVTAVALSPDGLRIVTASEDSTAKIWDAATVDQLTTWQREEKVARQRLAALAQQQAAVIQRAQASSAHDPAAIKQWLILGPISFDGRLGAKALAQEQIADEANLHPRSDQHVEVGANPLSWRAIESGDYLIDFRELNRANAPWSVAYAVSYIHSELEQRGLTIRVGSEDQCKIFLNGSEIYRRVEPRKYVPDQDLVPGVVLKAGLNVLVFKLVNEEDYWRGSIRFTDQAGHPARGIRATVFRQAQLSGR